MDPRVKRTRRNIKKSFEKLMEGNDFDNLSITDIVKDAEINRSTFYDHYEDKYHLLVDFFIEKVFLLDEEESRDEDGPPDIEEIISRLEKSLLYCKEHKEITQIVYTQCLFSPYFQEATEFLKEHYLRIQKAIGGKDASLIIPNDILAYFSAAGFNYIFLLWMNGELNCSVREMAVYTLKLNIILTSSMKGIDPKSLPIFDWEG